MKNEGSELIFFYSFLLAQSKEKLLVCDTLVARKITNY